jgi:hypothetical protein
MKKPIARRALRGDPLANLEAVAPKRTRAGAVVTAAGSGIFARAMDKVGRYVGKISRARLKIKMKMKFVAAALVALAGLSITGPPSAGVSPGDTITKDQADKVAEFVSPGNRMRSGSRLPAPVVRKFDCSQYVRVARVTRAS